MKRITLDAWAAANFVPTPTRPTLRAWARLGHIQPAPVKVGRTWYVEENATYQVRQTAPSEMQMGGMSERAVGILRNEVKRC